MTPLLDFALITHNHNDHYTERFTHLMDRVQRKTVVNNFFSNYGVKDRMKFGGYTRAKSKTFHIGDVTVITGLCDHNPYLIDFTTPFEVQIGNFTLYHSGDCYSHAKLHVSRQPDLWVLHPRCGMDPAKTCAEAIRPKKAVRRVCTRLPQTKSQIAVRWIFLAAFAALVALGFGGIACLCISHFIAEAAAPLFAVSPSGCLASGIAVEWSEVFSMLALGCIAAPLALSPLAASALKAKPQE